MDHPKLTTIDLDAEIEKRLDNPAFLRSWIDAQVEGSVADIWKVHAEVWRAEANRLIDETVNSIEGSTLDTLVVNALRIQAEHIAKRYEAKAVQETEG